MITTSFDARALFSFGTLMDEDVLAIVSGQPRSELTLSPATADGYAQRAVVTENFPVLVREATATAPGVIVSGLTPLALQRILFFEGGEYVLDDIVVRTDRNPALACRYFTDTAVYEVTDEPWHFQDWLGEQKTAFLNRTADYMQHFGQMTASEADRYW